MHKQVDRMRTDAVRHLTLLSMGLIVAFMSVGLVSLSSPRPVSASSACVPGWDYTVLTRYGSVHDNSGPAFKDYNDTGSYATFDFTSQTSGTVGVTVTVSGTFDIGAIIAGAQITTSVALTGSYSWTYGNNAHISVPPYRFGNGVYGAWLYKTYGEYYYVTSQCGAVDLRYITTYVPENASGWYVWVS